MDIVRTRLRRKNLYVEKRGLINSMTGFSRSAGHDDGSRWAWELKSVNARGLDVRLRTPAGMDALERTARDGFAKRLARGSINVSLTLFRVAGVSEVQVNKLLLDQFISLAKEYGDPAPRIDALLTVRGVIEQVETKEDGDVTKGREQAMQASFYEALEALSSMRAEEGELLEPVLRERLSEIESLVGEAEASATARPEVIKKRLHTQVAALLDAAPKSLGEQVEQRLAQELAILATKADIREELDRLTAHVAAARNLLSSGGACGRKLDFLCQEFNREANTLCSKSGDAALTRIGLALKAAVDQLREQVQNVE